MRVRKKPWARPELEKDEKVILAPSEFKGNWKNVFTNDHPIHLELGCGKGNFITQLAGRNKHMNYIAIDTHDELLVYVLRKVNDNGLSNVRIIPMDIEFITSIFDQDEIERIYINFCNPWPYRKHQKRRLTHTKFLQKYLTFLKDGSEVWFKTDDEDLFIDSLHYFDNSGFDEVYKTYDLYDSEQPQSDFEENFMTEYELKFISQGIRIKFAVFRLNNR